MIPNWPSHACTHCIRSLDGIEEFKAKIEASQESFLEMEVKEEVPPETIEEVIIVEVKEEIEEPDEESQENLTDLIPTPEEESSPPKRKRRTSVKERSPSPSVIPEKKPKRRKIKTPIPVSPEKKSEEEKSPSEGETTDNSQKPSRSKRKTRNPDELSKWSRTVRTKLEGVMRQLCILNCEKCEFVGDTFRILNDHYKEMHQMSGYARCCNRKFSHNRINDHMRYHLNKDAFKCKDCGLVCTSGIQLAVHSKSNHTAPSDCKYQCKTCGKKFSILSHLKCHAKSHEPKTREIKCELCDRLFTSKKLLQRHVLNIHEQPTTHICEVCGKGMASAGHLKTHSQTHKPTKTSECDICGKQYFYLSIHKQRVHGPQIIVKCEHCGLDMPKNNYRKHVTRLHTHVKIYKCTVCEKEFKLQRSFKMHMDIHLGIKYPCYFCAHQATSIQNRIHHMKEQHLPDYLEWRKNKFSQVRVKNTI